MFTVTLDEAPATGQTTTVDFATSGDTATSGTDFTPTNGTLTFAAGQTTQTVTVAITDDVYDDNGEQFTVDLSNASFGFIADDTGVGTINDEATPAADDTAIVSLTGPSTVAEGATTTDYTLTVDNPPTSDITVFLTYTGTATDGTDYAGQMTATISAGSTTATFTLPTTNDNIVENDETIIVTIDSVSGGGFEEIAPHATDNTVTTTITDDDSAAITINDITQIETDSGTTAFEFTVSVDNAVDGGFTVDFATQDDTATAG